eukprot:911514-Prymnesium_polylepis.2
MVEVAKSVSRGPRFRKASSRCRCARCNSMLCRPHAAPFRAPPGRLCRRGRESGPLTSYCTRALMSGRRRASGSHSCTCRRPTSRSNIGPRWRRTHCLQKSP